MISLNMHVEIDGWQICLLIDVSEIGLYNYKVADSLTMEELI